MSFALSIAEGAHDDIMRNAVWWAQHHSYDQAIKWRDTIYEQLESLRAMPESHSLAVENPEFAYELRERLVGSGKRRSYRAIFTIHEHTVYVLAVHRATQDVVPSDDLHFDPDE
jgi:plasmid stabilization system protein ParE